MIIDNIVKESIKQKLYDTAREEKDKQSQMLGEEDDDLFDDTDKGSDEKIEKAAPSKTVDAEMEKLKKGEVTPSDVIEKLNTIRSGKSFKEESISKKLDQYVSSLSKAEKTALLAFLKGIAQIVTGEIEPSVAVEPKDPGPDVEMKKGKETKTKSIKPNVIKAPAKEKSEKSPSSEDTSGPVPITPKKK
jgi:hypothetical protein